MSFPAKRWHVRQPVGDQALFDLPDLPPLLVQLLANRGIHTAPAADEFLGGRAPADDPFLLKGVPEAVDRLNRAVARGEQIAVFGDFDADGVTATALLVQVLARLGARVRPYIPDRVDEGYGLHLDALRVLYREGVRLVVTVDCGIRSVDEVAAASRGLDLIVTDHHLPEPDRLPPAVAVVNPRQPGCPYPFKGLAGVGIAYKLAQALIRSTPAGRLPADCEGSLLDLVALGTVADLAPLLGENRALVIGGLACLNEGSRPGVTALMADAGLRRGEVDAGAIGFRLGPRLNAAGRLKSAMLAYHLLTSDDPLKTRELALELGELNRQRQQLLEQTVAEASALAVAAQPDAHLYLAAGPDFHPGIVGLVASRLVETLYRPAVVVTQGPKTSRGSCRSIPEFHITEALDGCRELLIHHGGHRAAAGFTVDTANLDALRCRLQEIAAAQLGAVDRRPALDVDADLPLDQLGWPVYHLLARLQPCGADNPLPVLVSRGVRVRDVRPVGTADQHLKLLLGAPNGAAWDAILYRGGRHWDEIPSFIDVAYTLQAREWNGEQRLQLDVQDLRSAL